MDGWRRLGEIVTAERSRRWKSRAAFARHAGIASRVVDDIERGRRSNYSDGTLASLEVALGWNAGSCLRVVQGGQPRRDIDPTLSRLLEVWPQLSRDSRVMLVDMAERAVTDASSSRRR